MKMKGIATLTRLLAIECVLLAGHAAFGQTFGSIGGDTRDSTGAVVAGAVVTAINVGTNASRNVVTNEAGAYSFPSLPPGTYTVKVEKAGFKTVIRNQIELQVQLAARVDFELQIGQVSESIEVRADAALLVTENATVGTVIENKRIVELPLNGRNYLQLVSLAPNVSTASPARGRPARARAASARPRPFRWPASAPISTTTRSMAWRTPTRISTPSSSCPRSTRCRNSRCRPASIRPSSAARPRRSTCSPSRARTSITAPLFEFLRNDKLDANHYAFTTLRPTKDPFKWNQYGFTLGGPVRMPKLFNGKDKLFFMGNYESFRKRGNTTGLYSLAPAAVQGGDFSALPTGSTIPIPTPWRRTAKPSPRRRSRVTSFRRTGSARFRKSSWSSTALRRLPGVINNYVTGAGPPAESRPVRSAHGLCGVVEIHLGRPL